MLKKIMIGLFATSCALQAQAASVWKVSKNDDHVIIGGTIHLLSQSDYPLPAEYEAAYKATDSLVFETDIAKMSTPEFQQVTMKYMFNEGGKSFQDMISPETFAALKAHTDARSMPIENFLPFKPSFLAITLTILELNMMGINSAGVDQYFATKGLGDGKPNTWFEEPEQQLAMLANIGKGQEDEMIAYTLKDIGKIRETMPKMIAAWRSGNSNALIDLGITEMKNDYPEIYQDLLVQRNENWIPKIEALYGNDSTEFVLVGALHLVGEDSVLAKLKANGYTIEKM